MSAHLSKLNLGPDKQQQHGHSDFETRTSLRNTAMMRSRRRSSRQRCASKEVPPRPRILLGPGPVGCGGYQISPQVGILLVLFQSCVDNWRLIHPAGRKISKITFAMFV